MSFNFKSANYIGSVLLFYPEDKTAQVIVTTLFGMTPITASPWLTRDDDLEDIPDLESGDRVLIMFDAGDVSGQAYWLPIFNGVVRTGVIEVGSITSEMLASDAITSSNFEYGAGTYSTAGTAIDLANGDIRTPNFRVNGDTGAVSMTGSITANTGVIGGFSIIASELFAGSGASAVGLSSSGTVAFYAGNESASLAPLKLNRNGSMSIGSNFSVTTSGVVTASSFSATNSTFNGNITGGTIQIGSGGSAFYANTAGIYIGGSTFSASPFRVTTAGVLTATSGTIGGWTLASGSLSGGGSRLFSDGTVAATRFRTSTLSSGPRIEMGEDLGSGDELRFFSSTGVGSIRNPSGTSVRISANRVIDFDTNGITMGGGGFRASGVGRLIIGGTFGDYSFSVNEVSGQVRSRFIYDQTTDAAPNMVVAPTSMRLARNTSSKKYKRDIEPLDDAHADILLNLRPVWYRSTATLSRPDHSFYGLIAEEVAEQDPRLALWSEDGPESVNYQYLHAHEIHHIQKLRSEVDELKVQVAQLLEA